MSASMGIYRDETDVSYAVDFGRDREPTTKRSRHPEYRRKGTAPARVNGMHCRRNKRWTWGSGRGARMMNMRAFAGCLAVGLAIATNAALAVTIDMSQIITGSNPGNPASSPAGLGAVSTPFAMAKTETTNLQYVEFLNKVDANGTNPNGVYNANMGADLGGGIVFNSGAGAGSKYSIKSGTAATGVAYTNMPVNFVTWFSAARFVNWLHNGQLSGTAGTASMETGAYTLANRTSGTIASRNVGAQYFLPSANEWYKAAFYTGSGSAYNLYATASGTVAPTATVTNFSLANTANFNNVALAPVAVGSYVNSASPYGVFDMFGNVGEMTDTASGSNYVWVGGGFGGSAASWNATAAQQFRATTSTNVSNGFRIAAVPEPGTIALAGAGIAGLAGIDWLKRRKRRLAAHRAA